MKNKLMYILLLFFVILLVIGRAVYSKEVEGTKKSNNNVKENAIVKNQNSQKIVVEDKKQDNCQKGDIDGDGKISITDISQMNKYITGIDFLDDKAKNKADIDEDGKVSLTDLSTVNKLMLEK